jgi:polysaccharide biosynthesis protein PslH
MRILAVYPYIPYPLDRGAYHRSFQLLRALAQAHEVDLLAIAENGEGVQHLRVFEEFCGRVEFLPFEHPEWEKLFPKRLMNPLPATVAHWSLPHVGAGLSRMLAGGRYDAAHLCDIVLAQFFLRQHRSIPMIVDRTRVDLQYQLMERRQMEASFKERVLNVENVSKLWFYERAVAQRSALQVVCGPDDEAFVRRFISRRVPLAVIPNGVDLDYFKREAAPDAPATRPTLLFCGAMDYNPNVDALRWYFNEMHESLARSVPNLEVLIVGKNPVPEVLAHGARAGVTVTGPVPDVRPFYRKAWLQIVPLRIGGGTRLKIVESLALGTPVVSTTIGAQGLDLRHEKDILLADTGADFIAQTARALGDAELRARLAANGSAIVRDRLSWTTLGRALTRLYTPELIGQPAASPEAPESDQLAAAENQASGSSNQKVLP